MKASNKRYDRLKSAALVLLPAVGALYFGLGQIWGFPKIEEVLGSITVVETFLGVLVKFMAATYTPPTDGTLQIKGEDEFGMPILGLEIQSHPDEMNESGHAVFKVDDLTRRLA